MPGKLNHLLNFIPMVQTDISQLSQECSQWIEHLHSYRDELNLLNKQLQQKASSPMNREDLTELEHFQNQFQIQLINVHDVKQEAKQLSRKVQYQLSASSKDVSEETYHNYEKVADDYETLEHTLEELRSDFNRFVTSI
jgi:seryl-tRNA synthetase